MFFIHSWSACAHHHPRCRNNAPADLWIGSHLFGPRTGYGQTAFSNNPTFPNTPNFAGFSTASQNAISRTRSRLERRAGEKEKEITVGLFNYPILQAADILALSTGPCSGGTGSETTRRNGAISPWISTIPLERPSNYPNRIKKMLP